MSESVFITFVLCVCRYLVAYVATPADGFVACRQICRWLSFFVWPWWFIWLSMVKFQRRISTTSCLTYICIHPQTRSLYAGSDSGVVQSPTAFCGRYQSCSDCVLARDPYCAWDPPTATCVNIIDAPSQRHRYFYTFILWVPSRWTHPFISSTQTGSSNHDRTLV